LLVRMMLDPLEAQGVGDDHLEGIEEMATTRNVREDDVGTPTANRHFALDLAQPLPYDNRAEQEAPAVPNPHRNGKITPLDAVARHKVPLDIDRFRRKPGPATREQSGEDEAEPDNPNRDRPESP